MVRISNPGRGKRFSSSPKHSHRLWGLTNLHIQCIPGFCGRDVKFTTHVHLVSRLWMSGAVPLLPLSAFMAWAWTSLYQLCWQKYFFFFVVSLSSCRQISYGTANYATIVFFHILSSSPFSVPPVTGHTYYELLATSLNVPQIGRAVPAHAIKKAYRWNRGVASPILNFRIRWEWVFWLYAPASFTHES
jgi:hypothetical protein